MTVTKSIEVESSVDTGDLQLIQRVSVTVAYGDIDAPRLDAAAGCEFLDDRIRFEDEG